MNKENIKILATKTLEKYEGQSNISDIINDIRNDLNGVINTYLSEHAVYKEDFPIVFENELGKWQINADGTTYVQPKKATQYIECNFTIKRTGEIESYEKRRF